MSASTLVTPILIPSARFAWAGGASARISPPVRADGDTDVKVRLEPLDQQCQVRLVVLGRPQVRLDAGHHLLQCIAEPLVHVVAPHLTQITPLGPDASEAFGELGVEPRQAGPELRERLDIVDDAGHQDPPWRAPSNSAHSSATLISTMSGYAATPPAAMCSTRLSRDGSTPRSAMNARTAQATGTSRRLTSRSRTANSAGTSRSTARSVVRLAAISASGIRLRICRSRS